MNSEYEPIHDPENKRLAVYPIKFPQIWEFYQKEVAALWLPGEIDFSKDASDFNKLNENEQHFIKMVLGFFAASDIIVSENISKRFSNEIQITEAIFTYQYQQFIENIHCVSYNTLILTDQGYYKIGDLKNRSVNIWNGIKYSKVNIQYTGQNILYNIKLSNGMELECTSCHKWFININNKKIIKYTKDLNYKDIIYKYTLPILNTNNNNFINPYLHGYYCGNNSIITEIIFNKPLYFVPINYSLTIKILWLTGLYNSINTKYIKEIIVINNTNVLFLQNIQLMLTTLNIYSIIKINKLYVYTNNNNNNNNIYIKSITKLNNYYDTYCFNEPLEHAGIFNGILTGQSEVYSLMIDNIIKDETEKNNLLNAIENYPCIKYKADWAYKWMESDAPIQQRLIAYIIIEGIFFSGSFCSIYWIKQKNVMPGLCTSNEYIARDENAHCEFGILLYSLINNKIDQTLIHEMFIDAVEVEKIFICESLPCSLLGMNSELMIQYIQFVADRLLEQLKYNKIWNSTNPFSFMELLTMEKKANFFEDRVTEYQKSTISDQYSNFQLLSEF